MTLEEFYKLSKEESFERIKDESRSQAKRRLCGSLICLLIFMISIICIVIWRPQEFEYYTNNFYICLLSVFCIAAGWYAVNNLRFLRLVDTLGTPEHVLQCYEKTINNNRKAGYLFLLGCIGSFYPDIAYNFKYLDLTWTLMELTLTVAIIGLWVYLYFKFEFWVYKTRRDEEITDRLQDLIDMK